MLLKTPVRQVGDYGKGFLDSGAHTVETGTWTSLPIKEYTEFVKEFHRKFKWIVVPDDIGNPEQTKKNSLEFFKNIDGIVPPEKILSVYHMESGDLDAFADVQAYAKEFGCRRLCVASMLRGMGFKLSQSEKRSILGEIFKRLNRDVFEVHILGTSALHIITTFKPESVDAATILHAGTRCCWLPILQKDRMGVGGFTRGYVTSHLTERERKDFLVHKFSKIMKSKFIAEELGDNYDKYLDKEYLRHMIETTPATRSMVAYNGLVSLLQERMVQNAFNYDYEYWKTGSGIAFPNALPQLYELYKVFWKNRLLTTFPDFYGNTHGQSAGLLNMFSDD